MSALRSKNGWWKMSRYIDADAFEPMLLEEYERATGIEHNTIKMVFEMLSAMPTADVVPTWFHDKCMEIEIKKRRNMMKGKILDGGTLVITTDELFKVKRVLVEDGKTRCAMFYEDSGEVLQRGENEA